MASVPLFPYTVVMVATVDMGSQRRALPRLFRIAGAASVGSGVACVGVTIAGVAYPFLDSLLFLALHLLPICYLICATSVAAAIALGKFANETGQCDEVRVWPYYVALVLLLCLVPIIGAIMALRNVQLLIPGV